MHDFRGKRQGSVVAVFPVGRGDLKGIGFGGYGLFKLNNGVLASVWVFKIKVRGQSPVRGTGLV